MNDRLDDLLVRANRLLDRLEAVLPRPLGAPHWEGAIAWRYRKRSSGHGAMEPVRHVASVHLDDLKEIEPQKERIVRNTEQFGCGLLPQLIKQFMTHALAIIAFDLLAWGVITRHLE